MKKPAIFYGITQQEIDAMLRCFEAKRTAYSCGDTIVMYANEYNRIGILLKGEAELIRYEEDGTRTILERYDPDHIFGKLSVIPEDNASIICSRDCEVVSFCQPLPQRLSPSQHSGRKCSSAHDTEGPSA